MEEMDREAYSVAGADEVDGGRVEDAGGVGGEELGSEREGQDDE
jgi:hypothetical protein